METFRCARCGSAGPALERAPFGGPVGELLRAKVCGACFSAWKGEQVKLINELRLNVLDPAAYARVMAEMRRYLRIDDRGGDDA